MRADLTDITVVVDRSGSMASCRKDAVGGLNTFIDEQKKQPGEAIFTLVQFDNEYEFVHKGIPLKDVPACDLVPRGGTALLDAVGRAIAETGARLKAMPEDQRPGLVVFVILTDGGENASREFTSEAVRSMIETQTNTYKWQFTFLGANQDSFAAAGSIGIAKGGTANYANTSAAFSGTSSKVTRMRSASLNAAPIDNTYTPQELSAMAGKSPTS